MRKATARTRIMSYLGRRKTAATTTEITNGVNSRFITAAHPESTIGRELRYMGKVGLVINQAGGKGNIAKYVAA